MSPPPASCFLPGILSQQLDKEMILLTPYADVMPGLCPLHLFLLHGDSPWAPAAAPHLWRLEMYPLKTTLSQMWCMSLSAAAGTAAPVKGQGEAIACRTVARISPWPAQRSCQCSREQLSAPHLHKGLSGAGEIVHQAYEYNPQKTHF